MAIQTDFSVAVNGDIRYTGSSHGAAGAGYYTVIALHRFLQDLADDASSSGDDLLDITGATPSDRSTDNIITLNAPYNINAATAEYLFDGSIIQNAGDDIFDGVVNFGNEGIHIEIMQNGALIPSAFWNTVPNGETLKGLNRNALGGISHRFMVKTRTGGVDIDGRRMIGMNREFGKTYGEFGINGTSRGNNVLALGDASDLNNLTAIATIAAISDVTNTEGFRELDVDNNGTDEEYYSEWVKGGNSINTLYEKAKHLTRRGETTTIYGLEGQIFRGITHQITVDTPSGTFAAIERVTWTGGTGQMLAINSPTAATKMWIQLLTGVIPTDGLVITGGTSSATVTMDTTITARTVATPFFGVSTGSAIIGAYGVGVKISNLTASDKVFDLTGTQITPPNNVTFTVSGLISGEDRVLVAPESGGGIDTSQFAVSGTLSGAAVTTVTMSTSIPTDTPATGTIRVANDEGLFVRLPYTSYSGSAFTITAHAFNSTGQNDQVTSGNNAYVSYIDTIAGAATATFSGVYVADRTLFVRVRDGGSSPIKTFETSGTLGSSGGGSTAIRTSDS